MISTIYVLKCKKGKYYVGKTNKTVQERLAEHKKGRGSAWTRLYPPIEIVEAIESKSEFDEDNVTKKYMKKYGINNVRGGSYSSIELPPHNLIAEFCTSDDSCFNCGKKGHFVDNCKACSRCGRTSHTREDCYAKTNVFGQEIDDEIVDDESDREVCARCGRTSHTEEDCYAKTNVFGEKIDEECLVM